MNPDRKTLEMRLYQIENHHFIIEQDYSPSIPDPVLGTSDSYMYRGRIALPNATSNLLFLLFSFVVCLIVFNLSDYTAIGSTVTVLAAVSITVTTL